MASREPSEDEISQVVDFAGLDAQEDRSMVIQALKENGGNVESVVMQYFDDPASFRQSFTRIWNDSMFSADRDGSDNNTGISFHIESVGQNDVIQGVTPPPEGCGPGAPSRPPSRSNNRSPVGRVVDWTPGRDISGCSNPHSREDQDMQRALRESAQEAGIALPQQESGTLDSSTSVPSFGPATRSDYDNDSYAMVPIESKVVTDPAPEKRKRDPGTPAFLVQGLGSDGEHCLGGLITILHGIPLARNVLLASGTPAVSYGFNSEWWRGQEILPPQTLAKLQSGEIQWGERHGASPTCDEEIHRLMAFLDSTERSYGGVSVLEDLIPVPSLGPEKRFYEHLIQENGDEMSPLTQVATLTQVFRDDAGEEEARFGLLEVEHMRGDYANIKTLYESLDHIMWSDVLCWNEMHEGSKMAVFKSMAEVFAIKFCGDGPEDSIEIPQELYPERYLFSRKDEARRIQRGWCETKLAMESVAQEQHELYEWKNSWDYQSYDKKDMINKILGQWKAYGEYLESRGRFRGMEESGFDTDKYPDYRAAPCQMSDEELQRHGTVQHVLQLAERALSDMDEKLKELNGNLEQIKARQRFLGRLLTVPDKPGRPRPMTCKKFLLRGVATATDVVYLCQRSGPDFVETEDSPKMRDQWWRLAYTPQVEQPVKAEKMEVERVLRDMWQDTKTPLLVYATEEALSVPRQPLSSAQERFVRAENKAFRRELNGEGADGTDGRRALTTDVISPSKRKHRADSADSMDSNRASIGSDDRGFISDDPFEDEQEITAMEMAQLSEQQCLAAEQDVDMAPASGERDEAGPALPSMQPGDGEKASKSTTLTPDTLPPEHGESTTGEQGRRGTMKKSVDGDEAGIRAPEMRERSRLPAFLDVSQQGQTSGADMEMPDDEE